MSEVVFEPRPLKRQPILLVISFLVFVVWVAFLTWIYFHQLHSAASAAPN